MISLKKAFGANLKVIRKGKQYTQETLAEMIDLSPRQLIRIENGDNFPSAETIEKLSTILDIKLETLFGFEWNSELSVTNKENDSLTSETDKKTKEYYDYILSKLKKINFSINKLFFVKTAIDSLDDKKALKELKLIIKGMELKT